MKTYNTYQEAEIANPGSEIFTDGNIFAIARSAKPLSLMKRCHPKDYCMTMEKFLADGYKLVAGDEWLDDYGAVVRVDEVYIIDSNTPCEGDDERYVLKSQALEDEFNSSKTPSDSEWDGTGLPPVGVECLKIFNGDSQIVIPLYYDEHKSGMVMFYYRDSGESVGKDYDWCLVQNCIFRKPKTPRELFIERVCGKIKTSAQEDINLIGKMFDMGCKFEE